MKNRVLCLIHKYEKNVKHDYYYLTIGAGLTMNQALDIIALRNGYREYLREK